MSQTIKFHLDENVNNAVADGLKRRRVDVTTTSQVGLMGVSDLEQVEFALSENRAIFTHDDDLLKIHQKGIEHAGIIYCNQNIRSIGDIIRGLILIWEVLEPEELKNEIEFL